MLIKIKSGELTKGTPASVGYDVKSNVDICLQSGKVTKVSTGLFLQIQEGYYGQLFSRSSLASKGIDVVGGVIDSDYRGEIIVLLKNTGDDYYIRKDDRVAQFIFSKQLEVEFEYVDSLDETERGTNGLGSTGK